MSEMSFSSAFFPSEPCLCPWNISLNACYNDSDLVWVGGGRDGGGGVGGGPWRVSTKKRKPPKCKSTKDGILGRGILQNAECRMALFSKGKKNNAKLFSRFICILRTMPFCILRSAKCPCVASLLHSRYSLKLWWVKRMKIAAFIPTSFPDNNVFILRYCVTEQLIDMSGLPVV